MYAYVQKINEKKLPTAETANVYIKSKNNTEQARNFYLPIAQMIICHSGKFAKISQPF